jgi:hypothetical protein
MITSECMLITSDCLEHPNGFQVSWDPPVWMLDTPGVLTPRVDGGWEAALRLGVLDLIKYGESSLEPVAAYALHHIARTSAERLDRWPRVSALVHRTSGPDAGRDGVAALVALTGSGPDVFESRVTPGAPSAPSAPAADPAEIAERHARRVLSAVALDLGMTRRAAEVSRSERRGAEVPDTANAARKVLALLRQGELGPFCLDLHPPDLETRGPRSARGSAEAAAWSGIGIRKPKRGVKEQSRSVR